MELACSHLYYLVATLHDSLVFHKVELTGKRLDGWMDEWLYEQRTLSYMVTQKYKQAECGDIC